MTRLRTHLAALAFGMSLALGGGDERGSLVDVSARL